MNWSEHLIAREIANQTLAKKCVVLVDNCNWTGYECDVLAVTTDLRIIDVEVKISRADLKADAKKDKWWIRQWGTWVDGKMVRPEPIARQHPVKVWKHYYALPKAIWDDKLFDVLPSKASGVLLLDPDGYPRIGGQKMLVTCVRRATPAKDAHKLTPAEAVDIARLANLRMWEAYNRRDNAARELTELRKSVKEAA